MIDNTRLAEIAARAKAALAGPWAAFEQKDGSWDVDSEADDDAVIKSRPAREHTHPASHTRCSGYIGGGFPDKEDAAFCAHARQDIPDLIAEIRRLNEILEDYEDAAREAELYD